MKKLIAIASIAIAFCVAAQTTETLSPDEVRAIEQYRLYRGRTNLTYCASRCKDTNALAEAAAIIQAANAATNAPTIQTSPSSQTPTN